MTEDFNPLLHIEGLPIFSALKPEHVFPAVKQAIEHCRNTIIQVTEKAAKADHPTWDSVMAPIEEADDKFSKMWAVVSHLNAVCNTPELRQVHDECLPLIAEYSTWAGQYQPLFETLKRIKNSDELQLLTRAQQISIDNSIRDFKLTGVDLPADKKERFAEISAQLSQLESDFANHVLDATHSYIKHVTDKDELKGLPAGSLKLARAEAEKRGLEGWVLTLDMPSYLPAMMYADNRELRRELGLAYNTRASELGPDAGKFDNKQVMENILRLRQEQAELLGFKSYAHLSLATKMAKDPDEVVSFLKDLACKSKPQGEREMAELAAFAKEQGCEKLEPWDLAYYSEKLREHKFAFNAEQLRPYFPVDKVVAGLFECARRVYDITIRPRFGVDVWHDDVSCYDVYDSFGSRIGTFYLDLYAREGKRGGAWMDECQSRRYRRDGALQLPVAYLVCNFTPPIGGRQAELTHGEVVTLFHEFGHGLNQLLTRIDISDVSGINGVPWDAVELPSQFNEEFAWQQEVLNFLSSKVGTGEPLPADKLKALLDAKNFQSAMSMLSQLEFALFDFTLHLNYDPAKGGQVYETQQQVCAEVSVVPRYPNSRFPNSFTHIFAGGYAAGYYSYKWAEVLAADAFGRFLEEGIFNKAVGQSFRDNILAMGGACDPLEAFVAFRGRKPSVDALLVQSGISFEPEAAK